MRSYKNIVKDLEVKLGPLEVSAKGKLVQKHLPRMKIVKTIEPKQRTKSSTHKL